MNVVIYLTKRVMYEWPLEYVNEFAKKVFARDGYIHVISDDTEMDVACEAIGKCDYFVGVPNKFDSIPTEGKRVILHGPTRGDSGIKSTTLCMGCKDHTKDVIDCIYEDYLCMKEILPNDILAVMR